MLEIRPIFQSSPYFSSCHASTIVALPGGHLLAAWFAGTEEGHPDVAVWLAHHDGERWHEPTKVADQPGVPLWNPVLFRDASDTVWLFYKVSPTIPAWTGVYVKSHDGGHSWSSPCALPAGMIGPAKNKPITLSNGDILCGSSSESWRSWACWCEITADGGKTWSRHGPISAPEVVSTERERRWDGESHDAALPKAHRGVIQPTVWEYQPGHLKMLMRSTQAVGAVCVTTSENYGRTWSPVSLTDIPNPNSGLDAVRLNDGRIIMACNPTRSGRTPLSLLLSEDNGHTWPWRRDLEMGPGEYSYPSIIQAEDGLVHVVYTWRRMRIHHAVLEPKDISG